RSLSRGVRVAVDRGSMAYSAVTHPRPELRSHPGTPGSIVALVSTRVLPNETSTEPSAVCTNPVVSVRGRIFPAARPSERNVEEGIVCIKGLYESPHPIPAFARSFIAGIQDGADQHGNFLQVTDASLLPA